MALVKIQVRRDTAANWTATNPVLAAGEPGLETDTGKVKYGDGVRNWNTLPYSSGVALGTTVPPAAGAPSAGTSETAARADHSHALPSNLTATTVTTTGNASVGGSLTVSGSLVGGSHRHFASEIEGLTSEVFAQLVSAIKPGANVTTTVDSVARTITVASTATASTPLAISSDPLDVISSGATASFTSRAVGGAGVINYQWEQSTDDGKTWTSVPGATGITLTVSGIVAADDGKQYRLRAASGSETVFSKPAKLNVSDVTVTAQPADITTGVGGMVQLSVQANAGSAAITYQWQRRGSSTASWENIPTATLATYSYSATAVNDADGDQFRVAITSLGRTVYSRTATVLVRGAPISITTQPQDTTDTGGAASFTVVVDGGVTPYTYQWQRLNGGSSTWAATDDLANIPSGTTGVSGQATATLSLTGQNAAQHQRKYRVLISDSAGGAATSAVATLSTLSLVITVEPNNVAALEGTALAADAFKSLATADGGVTYQWQKSTDSGTTWANISGATSANYGSFVPSILDNNARYRCSITGDGQTLNTRDATLGVTVPESQSLRVTSSLDAIYAPVPSLLNVVTQYGYQPPDPAGVSCSPSAASISVSFTYAGGWNAGTRQLWWEVKKPDGSWEKWSLIPTTNFSTASDSGTYNAFAEALPTSLSVPTLPSTCPASSHPGWIRSGVYRIGFSSVWNNNRRTAYTMEFAVQIPDAEYRYDPEAPVVLVGQNRLVTTAIPLYPPCPTATFYWYYYATPTSISNTTGWKTISLIGGESNLARTESFDESQINTLQRRMLVVRCGDTYIPQKEFRITVQQVPLSVTSQPLDATAALGVASFSFAFEGGGSATPTIRWQRAVAGGGFADIAGATATQLNLSGLTSSLNGSQYRAVVTRGASVVTTRAATLTVPGSTITPQPRDTTASLLEGSATVTFDFTSTCATPLIVWERQAAGNTLWVPIPSATGKTLTLNGLTQAASGLKVRASVVCEGVTTYSAIATIAVPSFSTFVTQPSSQSVSPGDTVVLSFTSGLPIGTYRFAWQHRRGSTAAWAAWTGPTQGQTISFTASYLEHDNLRFRVLMYPWMAGPVPSREAVITVGQRRSGSVVDSLPYQVTGVACAKGAVVATASIMTQVARRSADNGATWRNVFLPSAEYWDGIVSTATGRLIAYTQGFESPSKPAKLAKSDDGGLTWSTLVTNRRLGERLQIRRVNYPAPGGALLAFYWSGVRTLVMGVSLDQGATWQQYPMPSISAVFGTIASRAYTLQPADFYGVQSVAMSEAGVLLIASAMRIEDPVVGASCATTGDGGIALLRRDVASAGWGTPTVVKPIAINAPAYASATSFVPKPFRRP